MKRLLTLSTHIFIFLTAIATVAGAMPPQAARAATATKTILEAGAHNPGDQVTIQIKFNKPNTSGNPVQVMIALDTSGSTASQLDTTKTDLTNFANSLSSYYGLVRVGIYGFGAGSNGDIFAPAVIDSTNIGSLKTAINNIYVGQDSTGFSPIAEGLSTANSKFATSGTRFLVLQTDGFDNQPNGSCPIAINGGRVPGVSGVGSTDLSIVPIKSTDGTANYYSKLGYLSYDSAIGGADPCRDYVNDNFNNYSGTTNYCSSENYGAGTYACSMLRDMTTVYTKAHLDASIQPQLDSVIAAAQISSITVTDLLNSSVFDTNPASSTPITYQGGWFTDCNGTQLATKTFAQDSTGRFTFISNSSNLNNTSQYCLNVKATIIPNPTTGTVPINSSSGNTVTYKNSNGTTLAQDLIGTGQIQINGANFTVDKPITTDASGAQKYIFQTGEQIYTKVTVHNLLSTSSGTGAVTNLYVNEPNPVPVGKASTMTPAPGMYITHGVFGPNSTYTYGSYPGGNYNSSYSAVKSWSTTSTGALSLRAYINYNNAVSESNYNDNQAVTQYGVIVNPSNLNAVPNTCHKATFTWTAGSGITSYSLRLHNNDDSTDKIYAAGSGTSFSATDLVDGPHNYSWWLTPQVQLDGVLRDGTAIQGNNFATPSCKIYSIAVGATQRVSPGAGDVTATINYTWVSGNWTSSDNIQTSVLSISAGTVDCSGAAYPGNNTPVNGLSAGINSATNHTAQSPWPNGPTPLVMNASPTTPFGTYTICVGSRSATADGIPANVAVVINVQPSGWIQIGTSPASGLFAGDVHSNGSISTIILPTTSSTFFTAGVAGVVSADTSINIKNGQISGPNGSGPNPPDWLAANYVQISTSPYTQLYNNALDSQQTGSLPTSSLVNGQFISKCSTHSSGNYKITDSPAVLSTNVNIDSSCNGTSIILFVDGDLTINSNIVDTSTTGTLTMIVRGNLTVGSNVTEMDGVYLFGGTFTDGGGSNQLLVKGSLLGLAGKTPGTNTGSFYNAGNTGLSRDLGTGNAQGKKNATDPAELIIYQPKYLATVKDWLGSSTFSWSE